MSSARAYEIRLPGTLPPASVRVNGQPLASTGDDAGWRYDGQTQTTIITVPRTARGARTTVTVRAAAPAWKQARLTSGVRGLLGRLHRASGLINNRWPKEWSPDSLVAAVQTGNRASVRPSEAASEFARLGRDLPAILRSIGSLEIGTELARRIVDHCAPLAAPSARKVKR
jgi:alpha-glucosidase